jgi:diaminopimelate epimerase
MKFVKMHGCGNDFVILDGRAKPLALSAVAVRRLADRRFGLGCDQLIVLEPAPAGADVFMRIYNPDGSTSGMCGNAVRCVATLVAPGKPLTIATESRLVQARPAGAGVEVDMGPPVFDPAHIPLAPGADLAGLAARHGLPTPTALSMGNPHVVFVVPSLAAVKVAAVGPKIEHAPDFPQRTNVEFVEVTGPRSATVRVWERGAGETLACGSGACAVGVVLIQRGLCQSPVQLAMPGGILTVAWAGEGVRLSGPTAFVADGTLAPDLAQSIVPAA